ncbi:MAG TPA: alpha/beta hydrolase [Geobacteraceae bacterium]|nr:alpha/beta hydrolase [Geobacteraceae bacterium]
MPRLCAVLARLGIGIGVIMLCGCSALLFHPERELLPNPVAGRFKPQNVFFPNGDGETLHGWYFQPGRAKGTVLVFHGNAENISTHVNGVLWLVQEGFNLFIIDYRGYGRSTGTPDLDGVHRDGVAALGHLMTLPGVDPGRVVILGQSLGGSVATYAAAVSPRREQVKLLVLDSAFSSYRQIAREKLGSFFLTWPLQYPLSWLFNDDYSVERWIGRVAAPVVILHDTSDTIVPFHHGDQIFAAATGQKENWATSGHGHISSFADAGIRQRLAARIAGLP